MRALSVRQPWAELIASGKKKIEYRSWKRDFRGDLLIVASASRHDDDCADERLDPDQLVYGAAVCVVDVWKMTGEEPNCSWHVRNPRRVEPVPVKGSASIYHVDDARIRFVQPTEESAVPSCATAPKATPKPRVARAKLAGSPRVVVAARDSKLLRCWGTALKAAGCTVARCRDGFAAWREIEPAPVACVVLDADVEGFTVAEVERRLRGTAAHTKTPLVIAGRSFLDKSPLLMEVKRAAGAEQIVDAVGRALALAEGDNTRKQRKGTTR